MRRIPYVLAALTALTLSVPAQATTCPLLTDPAGDAFHATGQPVHLSDSLDLRSLDVASGATTVVVVARVTSLAPEPFAAVRGVWAARFSVDGQFYSVSAERTGPAYESWFVKQTTPPSPLTAPLVVDPVAATFTWTLPRSWFAELATPGATFDDLYAFAMDPVLAVRDHAGDPTAVTSPTWVDGSTPCVPAA